MEREAKSTYIKEYPTDFLIHIGRPPTLSEAFRALEAVKQIQGDANALGAEIARTQEHLAFLVNMHTALKNQAEAQLSVLSPFRHIPDELLSEIFEWCLPTTIMTVWPTHAPMLVQSICRRWRDVARGTPILWASTFNLHLTSKRAHIENAMAEQWLLRAGSLPLTLSLGYRDEDYYYDPVLLPCPALDMALSQSNRWQTLWLRPRDVIIEQLSLFHRSLLLLENLTITNDVTFRPRAGSLRPKFALNFMDAPRLRSLELGSEISKDHLKIPWSNLTELVIGFSGASAVLEILSDCHRLMKCQIRGLRDENPPLHLLDTRLAHLNELSVEAFHTMNSSLNLLQYLTLPALQSLTISLQCPHTPFNPYNPDYLSISTHLVPLITRSRCYIQALVLDVPCLGKEVLLSCLEACPRLTTLELVGPGGASALDVEMLSAANLTRLRIDYDPNIFLWRDRDISRMLRSRQSSAPTSSPIVEIIITGNCYTDRHLLGWASDMQHKGLDVRPYHRIGSKVIAFTYRDLLQQLLSITLMVSDIYTIDVQRSQLFKIRLMELFGPGGRLQDHEQGFLSDLLPLVNEGLPVNDLFSTAEATLACRVMEEANELMLSDGIVYRRED
ncbi:hypothetical protein FIBSPDRAFT_1035312 [Athelia psychrophila]|uniref:MCM3-like winged helix domain-containing protein n=1 Tax=Athelia psychrophila TaxID=1759441 RepID=A0A166WY36_9AGAM|nr:hypothetical protein FIBSPDRAFT_1035312 [Fibularhizoctonia sp. CBS 109695]